MSNKLNTLSAMWLLIVFITAGCNDSTPSEPVEDTISFSNDVLPIFQQHGCSSCHGGEAGLFVTTVQGLLTGGDNGPAVIPGDSENSLLIQKLSPEPPFGGRMPLGGTPVPESQQTIIKEWIDEGAKDN